MVNRHINRRFGFLRRNPELSNPYRRLLQSRAWNPQEVIGGWLKCAPARDLTPRLIAPQVFVQLNLHPDVQPVGDDPIRQGLRWQRLGAG